MTTFPPSPRNWLRPSAQPPLTTHQNLLFHGDNKDVLAYLLCNGYRGKVNLVYIDPPFDSGADYVRKVELRGLKGTAKLECEAYTLGEQIQYTDIWANDNYLQFMYERLQLLRELLDDQRGLIALQCDWRKGHHLRCLLDEVFGAENFRGEVLIRAGTKNVQSQFEEVSSLTTGNNSIFLYTKSRDAKLPKLIDRLPEYVPGKWDTFWRGTDRPTMRYPLFGQNLTDGQWRWEEKRARQAARNYETYIDRFVEIMSLDEYYLSVLEADSSKLDFIRKDDSDTVQYYVPPRNYKLLSNVWFDISYRGTQTNYPTEKHEEPAIRLFEWLTQPGDLVLDCFIGSGTTAAVAQKLGRRWIGCDINKGAIQTTSKRLQTIINEQLHSSRAEPPSLPGLEDDAGQAGTETSPYSPVFSFAAYRVNDYDLQIQHNEAVQLACEAAHVERTRSDAFFDGAQDDRLVKIVPLNHPCTLLDLELVTRELHKRKDDHRDVLIVCLGKETTVDAWVEDWNKRQPIAARSGRKARRINQLEVLELRTSRKYGELFQHDPASATINIRRSKGKLQVEIEDFISPTILKRLKNDQGVLSVKVTDWRSMVDCLLIDSDYDGEVFNVCHSDVPAKKTDLVSGKYTLPAPRKSATVAVKLIDMLGEEVLETAKV